MNENEFGYRIRQALNEGLESLDYRTTYRLQQARQAALARHHSVGQTERIWAPSLQTADGPPVEDEPVSWLRRLGLAAPLLAVIIGFVGIYEYQESRRISELADMDFAVLLDDVPLETYADESFGALLKAPNEAL
jgi:hypothetical protein